MKFLPLLFCMAPMIGAQSPRKQPLNGEIVLEKLRATYGGHENLKRLTAVTEIYNVKAEAFGIKTESRNILTYDVWRPRSLEVTKTDNREMFAGFNGQETWNLPVEPQTLQGVGSAMNEWLGNLPVLLTHNEVHFALIETDSRTLALEAWHEHEGEQHPLGTYFIDPATYHILAVEITRKSGRLSRFEISHYQWVQGYLFPAQIDYKAGQQAISFTLLETRINPDLADDFYSQSHHGKQK